MNWILYLYMLSLKHGVICDTDRFKSNEQKMFFYFCLPSFPQMNLGIRSLRLLILSLKTHNVIWWSKVLLCQTFPLLAADSVAGADPGYRSPAQLCLPASVRLFIPGCTCVFVGMWSVAKLHRGECACVHVFVCAGSFISVCLPFAAFQTPSTPHFLPLCCHLSTREAFPKHNTNKVGQVHSLALFLSESNFQVVPTGKRVPLPQTMEP